MRSISLELALWPRPLYDSANIALGEARIRRSGDPTVGLMSRWRTSSDLRLESLRSAGPESS